MRVFKLMLLILLSLPLFAKDTFWERVVVSNHYDFKAQKALNLSDTFKSSINKIWASTWLHNAKYNTSVEISWYYFDNKEKSIIYQEKIKVKGTKPIVSLLDKTKAEYFPEAKYIVEFITNSGLKESKEFKVVASKESNKTKTNSINTISIKDDEVTIDTLVKKYPTIKKQIDKLELYRKNSQDESFSLILPANWDAYAKESPIMFNLISRDKVVDGNIIIAKSQLSLKKLSNYSLEEIFNSYIAGMVKEDRVTKKLQIKKHKNYTVATIYTIRDKNSKKRFHFITLHLSSRGTLILVDVSTSQVAYDVGKFLSDLSVESLEIVDKNSSNDTILHVTPVAQNKTKKE